MLIHRTCEVARVAVRQEPVITREGPSIYIPGFARKNASTRCNSVESGWWKFVTNESTTENRHRPSFVMHRDVDAAKVSDGLVCKRDSNVWTTSGRSPRPLHCGSAPRSPRTALFLSSCPFNAQGVMEAILTARRYSDSKARHDVVPTATMDRPPFSRNQGLDRRSGHRKALRVHVMLINRTGHGPERPGAHM